jgi:GNAT superfamily N-acetyltransferase
MSLTALKRTLTELGWAGVQSLLHPASPMDLDADWPGIDALLTAEEWPFVRADLEMSQAQPIHAAHVVRRGAELAGFFVAHGFGDVAYLDMTIVAPAWRGRGVARPLYVATQRGLAGCRGTVVHTTNDSARIVGLLGFVAGSTYTLLACEPDGVPRSHPDPPEAIDPDQAIALDARCFGVARPAWTEGWLRRPDVVSVGVHQAGQLQAFVVLRERRDQAWGMDLLACPAPDRLDALVDRVLDRHGDRRLECFVRDGGPLDAVLRARGFAVPDFFTRIGPLIEWRRGRTTGLGDGPAVHTLTWL